MHLFKSLPSFSLLSLLVFLYLLLTPALFAQTPYKPYRGWEFAPMSGYHFASNNVATTGMSLNGIPFGLDVSLVQVGLKNKAFSEVYAQPRLSLTTRLLKMNNTDTFGYCLGVFPTYSLQVVQANQWQLAVKLGYGLNFNTHQYDFNTNFDNRAISSWINFAVDLGLRANVLLNSKTQLHAGAGLYHVSNGSLHMPNGGINILYGQAGISFFPEPIRPEWKQKTRFNESFKRHWENTLYGLFAHRQMGYFDYVTQFWIFGISDQCYYKINRLYGVGLGLDGYYDATPMLYNTTKKVYEVAEKDKYYAALGLYNKFDLGPFFVPLGIYHYVYQLKNVQEPIYMKFGLGYKLNKHLFAGLFFKGTINKKQQLQSDFMEWSLGYGF